MKKLLFALFLVVLLGRSTHSSVYAAKDENPTFGPSEVITGINNYRLQNGLSPLQINNTLMALAQGHSDYQASIGVITHDGPGGSRPKDRAYNAGYGDGNFIFLSEIIYGGFSVDHNSAIEWWKNSPVHNTEMLRDNLTEIGAGVSTDGNWTYFTAELGSIASWTAPADAGNSSGNNDNDEEGDTSPPVVIAVPVVIATPRDDGSVIHIIRTGQAMWTVAAVYDIDLDELLVINGMTKNSIVKPGDEIIVIPANTSNPEPNISPTASLAPTHSTEEVEMEQIQPAGTQTNNNNPDSSESEVAIGEAFSSEEVINPNVKRIIVGAFVILILVIIGSMFIQKPIPPPPEEEDVVR